MVIRLLSMRTQNTAHFAVGAGILTASHMAWPLGCSVVLAGVVKLVRGLLVERARRKTLAMLCERAPEGVLIVEQQGSDVPAMTVKIDRGRQGTRHPGGSPSQELP